MVPLDAWTTARLLIAKHGPQARTHADCQALDAFLCGDVAASEEWERVSLAVEALLESHPASSRHGPAVAA